MELPEKPKLRPAPPLTKKEEQAIKDRREIARRWKEDAVKWTDVAKKMPVLKPVKVEPAVRPKSATMEDAIKDARKAAWKPVRKSRETR